MTPHFNPVKLFLLVLVMCLSWAGPALGDDADGAAVGRDLGVEDILKALAPIDTSCPQDTLMSFVSTMSKAYEIFNRDGYRSPDFLQHVLKGGQCLNFRNVPPNELQSVRYEYPLMLSDILSCVPFPAMSTVPNDTDVHRGKLVKWRFPHTEISIRRVEDGPNEGEFLFSPRTVSHIAEYYQALRLKGYFSNGTNDMYELYIYSPGWMIPLWTIQSLPAWCFRVFMDQAMWQWAGLALSYLVSILFFVFVYRWSRARTRKLGNDHLCWHKLAAHLLSLCLAAFLEYFIDDQINITGDVLVFSKGLYFGASIVFCVLAVSSSGQLFLQWLKLTSRIQARGINADFMKLGIRLAVVVVCSVIVFYAADYYGLPVTALFASAGIVGVAVALAARETLANFFGGISILLDRPFKAGDYIVLDSGERGEVKGIGMRSTRMLTRDDVLITIPNSIINNVKITNQSAPMPQFRVRIKVGVAYGSRVEQVERVLLEIASENKLLVQFPEPRIRFRALGDNSLDFELLCWAKKPHDRGKVTHQLYTEIYNRFNAQGISIPFPQRDVYLYDMGSRTGEGES